MADRTAIYHLFFRQPPFSGGYAIAAGMPVALEYLQNLRFTATDLQYLSGLNGSDEKPLFSDDFLAYLAGIEMRCDVDAVPEGTVLFAHEPLVRISGPLIQCQLVETGLLTIINFQTLVAVTAQHREMLDQVLDLRSQGSTGSGPSALGWSESLRISSVKVARCLRFSSSTASARSNSACNCPRVLRSSCFSMSSPVVWQDASRSPSCRPVDWESQVLRHWV